MNKPEHILPNFIIGGTFKAATTSVFDYLSEHPEVCGSSVKEPGIFGSRYKKLFEDGQFKCDFFFKHCKPSASIFMEATVGYLQQGVYLAKRIESQLVSPKLLFILRNPEDRLYSYYNYYVSSQAEIPASISFEKFVLLGHGYYKGEISSEDYQLKKGHYRALAAGRYIDYLRQYLEVFDMAQIKVMFYENFKKDNLFFINQICEFLDIDPCFYHKFEFKHSNVTYSARNEKFHHLVWDFYRRFFYNFLFHCPGFKENLLSIYKKFNKKKEGYAGMNPETRKWLEKFYKESKSELAELLGPDIVVPWN